MVQRIAIIKMKKVVIISKLTMSGIEFISDVIASFKLLFLEMSLNGLRILSILKAFKKESSYSEKMTPNTLAATIKKSRTLDQFFM